MTIEEKRYKDLQDYFSDKDCAKTILENDDEFKKWLERLKWHIKKCDELAMELKSHREAWEKAKRTVKAYLMLEEFGSEYQDDIEKLIEECRPKEGDNE